MNHSLTPWEQKMEDRTTALEKGQGEILDLLRPISETYRTASLLGKWAMGILVFISVSLGIILSFKALKN